MYVYSISIILSQVFILILALLVIFSILFFISATLGYFEFRLCQNNDPNLRVEQSCFDRNLLADAAGNTQFKITMGMEMVEYKLKLPTDVTCSACVFQWKYRTGNSWGTDPQTGQGCIGMFIYCIVYTH